MVATVAAKSNAKQIEELQAELLETKAALGAVEGFLYRVQSFSEVVSEARKTMRELVARRTVLKDELAELSEEIRSCQNLIDSSNFAMLSIIEPGPEKFLPLFDTMEKADPKIHGRNAETWREQPVSVLRLSPAAATALIEAGVVFIGQLQDLVIAGPPDAWWKSINGVTEAAAAAIADKLSDFVSKGGKR